MYIPARKLNRPPLLILPDAFGRAIDLTGAPAAASPVANQAYYLQFAAPGDCSVTSISFYCASGTNNHDLGLYDSTGARLVSRGATATSAAAKNTWTLSTAQRLYGGRLYWIGFSMASATPTVLAYTGTNIRSYELGMAIQGTAHPLPSSFTLAASAAAAFVPVIAIAVA